ncbi:MAG: hypothetical protein ACUVQ0_03625 [Thermoproteota archaeon]
MSGLDLEYSEEADELMLLSVKDGGASIPVREATVEILCKLNEEGFKLSISKTGKEGKIGKLIIKNAGPAAIKIADDISDSINGFRLSWDGKDLKIIGLKIGEEPLELSFIRVPITLDDF